MEIALSEEETKEALRQYVSRDVLGVCGKGFKGTTSINYNEDLAQYVVTLTLPHHREDGTTGESND